MSPGTLLVLVIQQKLNSVEIACVPEDFLFLIHSYCERCSVFGNPMN